ncbi:hypothetical protein FISHEDRAFT_58464 [Fistulina hepatica ATCC 64428]|uniref:Uncharacterized protein n=1 Tax=Fistulina hepatica ATCC 64428 TaxID=1128425 RepID=A0A0D7AE50_9AGAR|nr:hypothetical protein FISHEDRAFT_58464 [Fistulina hepatica ATCC 64428]
MASFSSFKSEAPDPRASVGQLLARAYSLPCSAAAQAFSQLVQPVSRFQLALDALLPLLDAAEPVQRILVAFILYSMYAPHPMNINPFKSVLYSTYVREREAAIAVASTGGVSPTEQFVWVLWKILKGDGNDIAPYTPSSLARSPLPAKLRASNLQLDSTLYNSLVDDYDNRIASPRKMNASDGAGCTGDATRSDEATVTKAHDLVDEQLARAMNLVLLARDRVLTLAEQKFMVPLLPHIAATSMLTSLDIPSIVVLNPTIAHPLLVALLLPAADPATPSSADAALPFLDALTMLPPALPTFDVVGRLLRGGSGPREEQAVAALVREQVLGRFVHSCVSWIEHAEAEERAGLVSDDRAAKGVRDLCRFYASLIALGLVDPSSEIESAEMMHFSLQHARYEESNALYRVLAMSRM